MGPSCGISEPSWDRKCVFFLAFYNTFCKFVFLPQDRFRRHLGAQFAATWVVESGQEHPKSGQETLKRSSRAPQSGPRRPQERPRAAQAWPKSGPRAAKSGPRATKSDPRAAMRGPRASQNCEDGLKSAQETPPDGPAPPKRRPKTPFGLPQDIPHPLPDRQPETRSIERLP